MSITIGKYSIRYHKGKRKYYIFKHFSKGKEIYLGGKDTEGEARKEIEKQEKPLG